MKWCGFSSEDCFRTAREVRGRTNTERIRCDADCARYNVVIANIYSALRLFLLKRGRYKIVKIRSLCKPANLHVSRNTCCSHILSRRRRCSSLTMVTLQTTLGQGFRNPLNHFTWNYSAHCFSQTNCQRSKKNCVCLRTVNFQRGSYAFRIRTSHAQRVRKCSLEPCLRFLLSQQPSTMTLHTRVYQEA